ncbi:UDP-N-acetylmuramoyl-tripeptide--D-alanyl-D-alanine ligase [Mycoplasmatota bacterium]|nr:UDP-N-acetylmuramoyl-tripeptide--D-alanyl-D-alanine ligase [Mycoplasmatota bacterium]
MNIWFNLLLIGTSILYLYILVKRYLYSCFILQLEHYQLGKYLDWFYKNKTNKKLLIPLVVSLLALILILFISFKYLLYFELVLGIITMWFINYKQEKKKLKITNRMKRMFSFTLFLAVVIFVINYLVLRNRFNIGEIIFIYLLINNFLVYDLVLIGSLLALPLEKYFQYKFIMKARSKILENNELKVIGITGSYGKTSTKFIIGDLLKKAYNVCITPNSYNTPMGVTLTVNEYLRNIDDYFVCEMGACRVGEIKELCDIVFPKIGVISSIGPQHLETFRTIKNIINTKFELVESLPSDGLAILNYDNYYIRNYIVRNKIKILTYGIEQSNVDYYALNIHYGTYGSTFEVQFPNKERYLFKTKLLGKHNICNILAGIALADYLEINIKKIIVAVEQLEPVAHRLELKSFSNYHVIDDSFNANIEGCANALDILSHFDQKKIIITPGMIELGREQYDHNYRFGEKIAQICDYVVLVGRKQTKPIRDALIDIQFPEENIFVTNQYEEGFKHIIDHFKTNFTVLIENDLPDNYSEN